MNDTRTMRYVYNRTRTNESMKNRVVLVRRHNPKHNKCWEKISFNKLSLSFLSQYLMLYKNTIY